MKKASLIKPPVSIFKKYDVRSPVGTNLDANTYYTLGVAIGSELREIHGLHTLLLCRDSRMSSNAFAHALIDGLALSGIYVIDIGCLPIPLLHFALKYLQCKSGLMITGSHNPADHNGLKVVLGGENYYGGRLLALYQRIEDEKFRLEKRARGVVVEYSAEQLIAKYIATIQKNTQPIKKLRIVVDCSNAVAGYVAPQLLTSLGCEVIPLHCEVKSIFAHHCPDPTRTENLNDLRQMVMEQHADLGIAFDGDGDRLGVVDNDGCVISGDYLLLALADNLLKKQGNSSVVCDVKCTQNLNDYVHAHHGRAIMAKAGIAHIIATMMEHKASLGGEFCGHFYFNDRWINSNDGIYAAVRILELLSEQSVDDSHLFFAQFPKSYSTGELKIEIAEHLKEEFMRQFLLHAPFYLRGELIQIDGLRANLPNAWGLIRASNTRPYLTLRFEAKTMEALQEIQWMFAKMITMINSSLRLPF